MVPYILFLITKMYLNQDKEHKNDSNNNGDNNENNNNNNNNNKKEATTKIIIIIVIILVYIITVFQPGDFSTGSTTSAVLILAFNFFGRFRF